MTETFEWQNRLNLVEEVAEVVRRRIYGGVYPPGMPLRQVDIADDLKISRTPLREALRLLEREGLVTADTVRGVNVINASTKQLMHAYQLREVLDGLAARLAATHASHIAMQRLAPFIQRQRQSLSPWSVGDYTAANVDFHAAIIRMTDNEYIIRQIPIVHMTSQIFRPGVQHHRASDAIEEHQDILQAIAQGDAAHAEKLAKRHIQRTIKLLGNTSSYKVNP